MIGYNFTGRVRKVLVSAGDHARRLHHPFIAPDHLLLAILDDRDGVSATVLQALQVDLDQLQKQVEGLLQPGSNGAVGPDLPYTSRAKNVLENAMAEAQAMRHNYLACEHLLLGLLKTGSSDAATVLAEHGVTLERARTEAARVLGTARIPEPVPMIAEVPPAAALKVAKRAQLLAGVAMVLAVVALLVALVVR